MKADVEINIPYLFFSSLYLYTEYILKLVFVLKIVCLFFCNLFNIYIKAKMKLRHNYVMIT